MLDDERATQPLHGVSLLGYTLGELDSDQQTSLEKRIESEPALKEELEEIRQHLKIHQAVRKVAPRRGSFERLSARMKKEGQFQGAIPGVHAMARRSFILAFLVGITAIAVLIAVGRPGVGTDAPDVIGQIMYHNPSLSIGERRAVVQSSELHIWREGDQPPDTGAYDAYVWLPTGVNNTYSTIELAQNTKFRFTQTRTARLDAGFMRRLEIQPGGIGEGPFTVITPHCRVEIEQGGLSIGITRDGVETQISVGQGSASVYGLDSDQGFVIGEGRCTSVERGQLPNPPRPLLKLMIESTPGELEVLKATLVNDSYVPVKVNRAIDASDAFGRPVYMISGSYGSEYLPDKKWAENNLIRPQPVTPMADPSVDHSGEVWLDPGEYYTFRFDVSSVIKNSPPVTHWLILTYKGNLYGPPGEARMQIESNYLKLDLRKR
ncbi:MAG: hypothetical protein K8I27_07200 [Planctomycetes bacterium]|nr:hypothetical protein [Planctomycetota bacterium]